MLKSPGAAKKTNVPPFGAAFQSALFPGLGFDLGFDLGFEGHCHQSRGHDADDGEE